MHCHRNHVTGIMKSDLVQDDRSLSALYESHGGNIVRVLGADLAHEINLLFVHKPGPALRHEFAHGKFPTGGCYHPVAIYACWLTYRVTCLPLLPVWAEQIAPAIEAAM